MNFMDRIAWIGWFDHLQMVESYFRCLQTEPMTKIMDILFKKWGVSVSDKNRNFWPNNYWEWLREARNTNKKCNCSWIAWKSKEAMAWEFHGSANRWKLDEKLIFCLMFGCVLLLWLIPMLFYIALFTVLFVFCHCLNLRKP